MCKILTIIILLQFYQMLCVQDALNKNNLETNDRFYPQKHVRNIISPASIAHSSSELWLPLKNSYRIRKQSSPARKLLKTNANTSLLKKNVEIRRPQELKYALPRNDNNMKHLNSNNYQHPGKFTYQSARNLRKYFESSYPKFPFKPHINDPKNLMLNMHASRFKKGDANLRIDKNKELRSGSFSKTADDAANKYLDKNVSEFLKYTTQAKQNAKMNQDLNHSKDESTKSVMTHHFTSTVKWEQTSIKTFLVHITERNNLGIKLSDSKVQSKKDISTTEMAEKIAPEIGKENDIRISIFGDFEHFTSIPREKKELSANLDLKSVSRPENLRKISLALMGLSAVLILAVVTVCYPMFSNRNKRKRRLNGIQTCKSSISHNEPFTKNGTNQVRKNFSNERRCYKFPVEKCHNKRSPTAEDCNLKTISKQRLSQNMSFTEKTDTEDSKETVNSNDEKRLPKATSSKTLCKRKSLTLKNTAYVTRQSANRKHSIHREDAESLMGLTDFSEERSPNIEPEDHFSFSNSDKIQSYYLPSLPSVSSDSSSP